MSGAERGAKINEIADAIEDARDAKADAKKGADVTVKVAPKRKPRRSTFGDSLPELAFLWIAMSIILKITYKGRLQAEVKAAQATETAEAESLKRQGWRRAWRRCRRRWSRTSCSTRWPRSTT